jgi:hypothetical protein
MAKIEYPAHWVVGSARRPPLTQLRRTRKCEAQCAARSLRRGGYPHFLTIDGQERRPHAISQKG